ncbi:uncharacterized protein LOC6045396 [Culex quinquefasciatus]|uniref:uncharacterized protein LOC6045396 n=2 Tax=Culex pipiens complex TaxID=518105 RepID=UPI0018E2F8DB|nr:uncharacterized protein LOC6045396 [Culex quinquefasciatus]
MVAIGKILFLGVVLLIGVTHGYQVKPRNYDKIVQQQMKFNEEFEKEFLVEHLLYTETGNMSVRLQEMFEYLKHKPDMFRQELDNHP